MPEVVGFKAIINSRAAFYVREVFRRYIENYKISFSMSLAFLVLIPIFWFMAVDESAKVDKASHIEFQGIVTEAFRSADGRLDWQVVELDGGKKQFKKVEVEETQFQNNKIGSKVYYSQTIDTSTYWQVFSWMFFWISLVIWVALEWHFLFKWADDKGSISRRSEENYYEAKKVFVIKV